jgi:hypothetical protein
VRERAARLDEAEEVADTSAYPPETILADGQSRDAKGILKTLSNSKENCRQGVIEAMR